MNRSRVPSMYQKHVEDWLKHRLPVSHPQSPWFSRSGARPDICISRECLMISRDHTKYCWFKWLLRSLHIQCAPRTLLNSLVRWYNLDITWNSNTQIGLLGHIIFEICFPSKCVCNPVTECKFHYLEILMGRRLPWKRSLLGEHYK